jgi:hypothetical protein
LSFGIENFPGLDCDLFSLAQADRSAAFSPRVWPLAGKKETQSFRKHGINDLLVDAFLEGAPRFALLGSVPDLFWKLQRFFGYCSRCSAMFL